MADELKPGQVLGETYRLVEIIGKGGMGEVWRARHERLPKEVAVKVLNASTLGDETSLARFRREAEIATRLGHPGIVGVFDFNTLPGGIPYMVMELLAGESLRDRMKRGKLPLGEVTLLLRQVGAALAEAHRQGVVHRDLKPENIFLVPEPGDEGPVVRAKVLDFGISKIQGGGTALTQEAEVLGTPVYMAPEQAAGRLGAVSGATDQYALATIAYEALSGVMAFSGHTLIEVLARILEDDPKPLVELTPGLPEHVYVAVRRALSKRPDDRFESVTAFVEAFSGVRPASGVQASLLATGPGAAVPSMTEVGGGGEEGAFARTLASAANLPALAESAKIPESPGLAVAPSSSSAGSAVPPGPELTPSVPSPPAPCLASDASAYPRSTTSAGEALQGLSAPAQPRRWRGLLLGGLGAAAVAAVVVTVLLLSGGKEPGSGSSRGQGLASEAETARDAASPGRTAPRPRAWDASASPTPQGSRSTAGSGHDAQVEPYPRPRNGEGDRPVPERPRPPSEPSRLAPPERRPPPRAGELHPMAAERLREAREAIARGDWATAHRTALASTQHQQTAEAFFLMTQARCGQKDLRLARPMFLNLSGAFRRRALIWCKQKGVELDVK